MRIDRRGFLHLVSGAALAAPTPALAARAAPSAYDVHRATRNSWHGPLALGALLSERPWPEKPYPGAPRSRLPPGEAPAPLTLAAARGAYRAARAFSGEPTSLPRLSTLLALANGVTGVVAGSDPPELRRAAPSAGALYAGEVYVVAERVDGLARGVYSYNVAEHALVALRSGSALVEVAGAVEQAGALAGAACAVLLTNVFARYAWRYGARAYRYALIDSGHIGENLRLAAMACGLGHARWLRFEDDALAQVVGIDGRREAVCALHALGHATTPGDAPPRRLVETGEADPALDEVERYHEATKLAAGPSGPDAAGAAWPDPPAPPLRDDLGGPPPSLGLAEAIRRRRSAPGFREAAIPRAQLDFTLAMAGGAGVAMRLVVHRVQGLAPGLYDVDEGGALTKLREGDYAGRLVRACLFQAKAGSAAVAIAFVASLDGATGAGARAYRDRLLRAGAAAQRVYLAAESLGLAARNLAAFYDDTLNALLGIDGRTRGVVHFTLLGPEA